MTKAIEILQQRLRERLAASGQSARAVSLKALNQPDVINNILNKQSSPSFDRLIAIATALDTDVGYFIGTTDDPTVRGQVFAGSVSKPSPAEAEMPPAIPKPAEMDKDIPVYGTALGAELAVRDSPLEGQAVEMTDLDTGEVIDFLRRPPALKRNRKVYGLYVVGSSMDPVFESGSAIVIEPSRPPAIRDFVVVYLRDRRADTEGGTAAVLIKRLVRRSASFIELEQYNPAGTFSVPTADVKAMHRVLSVTEMLGI